MIRQLRRATLCLLILAACSHSDSFTFGSGVGPNGNGSDVLLTYNSDQDYWPTLTEDGRAIVYAFVDGSQASSTLRGHRCIGVMPVTGGTRVWEWCDNRATQSDSVNSIPAFALGSDGRLLYLESVAPRRFPFAPPQTTLWLADSAAPYRRRALLTLPMLVGDSTVSWLADLAWTGPSTFIGLAQRMVLAGHCEFCSPVDSVFFGEMVVRGSIGADSATLSPVAGTAGATSYALAEDGASIVFTRRDNANLVDVPASGGAGVPIPTTPRTGVQLFGVSCRGVTCIVALGPVTLWTDQSFAAINSGAFELRRILLTTGQATTVLSLNGSILASPIFAPSGDVIVQLGRMFGHLQTFTSMQSDLHLYRGLAQ